MTGLVIWCTERARMVLAFVVIAIGAGIVAYNGLPKEGPPNIDIPVLYVSVPLPGVSATDSERLLVKPLETELRGLDDLKQMTGIASESHAGLLLEFEFEWDKQATLAEVRDKVDQAKAEFPEDAQEPTISEINLSEFPILVVSLSGAVPERTLVQLAKDLRREIESDARVLEAKLTGHRDEMLEVLIDPLKMEAYNVTAQELLNVVSANNALVAAGEVESGAGAFAVEAPEVALDILNVIFEVATDDVCIVPRGLRITWQEGTGWSEAGFRQNRPGNADQKGQSLQWEQAYQPRVSQTCYLLDRGHWPRLVFA